MKKQRIKVPRAVIQEQIKYLESEIKYGLSSLYRIKLGSITMSDKYVRTVGERVLRDKATLAKLKKDLKTGVWIEL